MYETLFISPPLTRIFSASWYETSSDPVRPAGYETKFSHIQKNRSEFNLPICKISHFLDYCREDRLLIAPSRRYDTDSGTVLPHQLHLIVSPLLWRLHILLSLTANLLSFDLGKNLSYVSSSPAPPQRNT